ncbi:MAG: hypothetical protein A3E87_07175 [Gammaproteobacteria bacterium RIFCSPHIGHO2_12_FULL_35_23]|nr:MAG: hypothetical protein A3E87_07175 [Gammaproteobacteria bacterium RIFCSPHIGHO2_12_FULL_35_23]
MRYIGYLIVIVLLIVGISFAILNSEAVPVNYYIATKHVPLSLLMVICFGIGVIIGILILFLKMVRLRIHNRLLRRQVSKLKQEVEANCNMNKGSCSE